MTNKSMVDVAYDLISSKKRAIPFAKLWMEVARLTGSTNEKVAQFYSDLTLDGRFAALKDNKWDLKSRRKSSESHIDLKKIEIDDPDADYVGEDEEESSDDSEERY